MNANMYCGILKQSMIPSLCRLGRRAVFQHDNDYCLAKEAEGKGNLWGILKRKVEERKVSNIHQLCDVVMEEWKRTPVEICEALVNYMPKRVKAALENNSGHKNIDTLGPIWTFSLRGALDHALLQDVTPSLCRATILIIHACICIYIYIINIHSIHL